MFDFTFFVLYVLWFSSINDVLEAIAEQGNPFGLFVDIFRVTQAGSDYGFMTHDCMVCQMSDCCFFI